MKYIVAAVLALSVGAAAFASPQTGEVKKTPAKPIVKATKTVKTAAKPAVKTASNIVDVCAITGEKVPDMKTAEHSEYKGKTYYFCCTGCKPQFDKEPAKFAAKADAAMKTSKEVKPAVKKS